ncbi:hypothetical protein AMOR_13260 [Anaeromyxobacter oryzae]|uniref:Uncharacterized protein n=1 Tax=Anaeromyxobacter oryzae TaxID=2918170 RepID=A0ABN6MN01_9BACT|nr:hypothetical protein AMOR_13260 [Anaeromyxobacter oryzae]
MPNRHSRHGRPSRRDPCGRAACRAPEEHVPVSLDRLRGELYRLLDQLPRAPAGAYAGLVLEFERGWEEFKASVAASSPKAP